MTLFNLSVSDFSDSFMEYNCSRTVANFPGSTGPSVVVSSLVHLRSPGTILLHKLFLHAVPEEDF